MRVAIDDYAYVFVKLAAIKSLLMTPDDLKKLDTFHDLDSLEAFTKRFFPTFNPKDDNILSFERALWETYFDVVEKILASSPEPIQFFLKGLLIKFEIWNLKIAIYGVIQKYDIEKKLAQIYFKPSQMLEREGILKSLLKARTIEDLSKVLARTPYEKIFATGITKFKETGDIFYLEHELDKYYLLNLVQHYKFFPSSEKQFIEQYVNSQIDLYSLNLLYRAYFNSIPREIIRPYLIPNGFLFKEKELSLLLDCYDLDEFISNLNSILKSKKELQFIPENLKNPDPQTWERISEYFLNQFLQRFQSEILEDIPKRSLALIFQLMLKKQVEIQQISGRVVDIQLAEEIVLK